MAASTGTENLLNLALFMEEVQKYDCLSAIGETFGLSPDLAQTRSPRYFLSDHSDHVETINRDDLPSHFFCGRNNRSDHMKTGL